MYTLREVLDRGLVSLINLPGDLKSLLSLVGKGFYPESSSFDWLRVIDASKQIVYNRLTTDWRTLIDSRGPTDQPTWRLERKDLEGVVEDKDGNEKNDQPTGGTLMVLQRFSNSHGHYYYFNWVMSVSEVYFCCPFGCHFLVRHVTLHIVI